MWYQPILKSYQHIEQWHLDVHEYYQEDLYQLNRKVQQIKQFSKSEAYNDRLDSYARLISYLLNKLISLPLPLSTVIGDTDKLCSQVREAKELASYLPGIASEILSVQELTTSLLNADSEILLKLMEFPESFNKENSVFCVDQTSMAGPVTDYMEEFGLPLNVDTFQRAIKKQPQWKNIIVAGPLHWFTDKILLPPCNIYILSNLPGFILQSPSQSPLQNLSIT